MTKPTAILILLWTLACTDVKGGLEIGQVQQSIRNAVPPGYSFKVSLSLLVVSLFSSAGRLEPRPLLTRMPLTSPSCKQGFPMQFCHLSAPRMLSDLLATSIAQDIIEIQGGVDSVRCTSPPVGKESFRVCV